MRARLLLIALVAALLLPASAAATGGTPEEDADQAIQDGVYEWIDRLSPEAWQDVMALLPDGVRELWSGTDVRGLIERYALTGEGGALPLSALKALFAGELRAASATLATFVGLSVLSGLVKALSDGGSGAGAAGFAMRCFVLALLLLRMLTIAGVCAESIASMSRFLAVALPTLLTLLTALGGVATAGILQPAMTLLTGSVTYLMRTVVLPLSVLGGMLGMLDQLTGRARLGELATLALKTVKWGVGIITVVYLGVTSVRGMAAAAYDGITVRTAKYAASSLLPVVGGMVSGTMDTMLGCAALVKNAAGLAAMLLLFSIALLPLIRILAWMLMLRLSAALAQPIADEKLPKMYAQAADMLAYLFAATAAVAMMFLLTLALAAGVSNLSAG